MEYTDNFHIGIFRYTIENDMLSFSELAVAGAHYITLLTYIRLLCQEVDSAVKTLQINITLRHSPKCLCIMADSLHISYCRMRDTKMHHSSLIERSDNILQ